MDFAIFCAVNPDNPRLLGEALNSLTILSNSNNLELQRSAALTFAEITEKGLFCRHFADILAIHINGFFLLE